MPAVNIEIGGRCGGNSIKRHITATVYDALNRRTYFEPPPITKQQLEDMTFEKIKDQHLYNQFAKRFPQQVTDYGQIQLRREWKFGAAVLRWRFSFRARFAIERPQNDDNVRMLFRHRQPEAYDRLDQWLEERGRAILEATIGRVVFDRAMKRCALSTEVNHIWPYLLKLDRSGRLEPITGRERAVTWNVPEEFKLWIPRVERWITEGLLMKEPTWHAWKTCKVHEGLVLNFSTSQIYDHVGSSPAQEAFKLPPV